MKTRELEINVLPWEYRGTDCMRVGFSGSSGVGKTTLAKAVNEYLQYKFVPEGVREWLTRNGVESLRDLTPKASMKMQLTLQRERQIVERANLRCVSDRTSLNNAMYCLYWNGREESLQRGVMDYVRDCTIHAVKTYDIIFMIPMGQFDIEDDGTRSKLIAYQLCMQNLINNAVRSAEPIYYVHLVQAVNLEERVIECMDIIDKAFDVKAKHIPEGKIPAPDNVGRIIQ